MRTKNKIGNVVECRHSVCFDSGTPFKKKYEIQREDHNKSNIRYCHHKTKHYCNQINPGSCTVRVKKSHPTKLSTYRCRHIFCLSNFTYESDRGTHEKKAHHSIYSDQINQDCQRCLCEEDDDIKQLPTNISYYSNPNFESIKQRIVDSIGSVNNNNNNNNSITT